MHTRRHRHGAVRAAELEQALVEVLGQGAEPLIHNACTRILSTRNRLDAKGSLADLPLSEPGAADRSLPNNRGGESQMLVFGDFCSIINHFSTRSGETQLGFATTMAQVWPIALSVYSERRD